MDINISKEESLRITRIMMDIIHHYYSGVPVNTVHQIKFYLFLKGIYGRPHFEEARKAMYKRLYWRGESVQESVILVTERIFERNMFAVKDVYNHILEDDESPMKQSVNCFRLIVIAILMLYMEGFFHDKA